jgi:hypothetical protein
VFITSTTRELLPVLEIERKPLKSGDQASSALQAAFSKYVQRYVGKHKAVPARAR